MRVPMGYFDENDVMERMRFVPVLEYLHPKYNVLEIGCANGSMTSIIAKKVNYVTAIEASEDEYFEAVEHNLLSNVDYINERIENLEVNTFQYDLVFYLGVHFIFFF